MVIIILVIIAIVLVLAPVMWMSIMDYKERIRYQRKLNDIRVEMQRRKANFFED